MMREVKYRVRSKEVEAFTTCVGKDARSEKPAWSSACPAILHEYAKVRQNAGVFVFFFPSSLWIEAQQARRIGMKT